MDVEFVKGLWETIQNAMVSNKRCNDVAVPIFDPEKSNDGTGVWCESFDKLEEFKWSSFEKIAKAAVPIIDPDKSNYGAAAWCESFDKLEEFKWSSFEKIAKAAYFNMDAELVKGLLETIRNAMVSNKRHDDVAVPIIDPDKSNYGAAAWCESFDKLVEEFKWSSFEKFTKAAYFNMDAELVKELLETIRNAMVSNKRHDDVAVPIIDPDKSNYGAAAWCESFDKLVEEFKWSSFEKFAKAAYLNMDAELVIGLLETIRNAMVPNKRHDDVAVPIIDPDKSNYGAAAWCESFDKLVEEFKWSSFEKFAKAAYFNMDAELVKGLLDTIRNAIVSNKRHDDVAVPIIDPDKSNYGAAAWCESFDKLVEEFKWSSFEKFAKAGGSNLREITVAKEKLGLWLRERLEQNIESENLI
ncbi:unnamed protein product [Parnassius apollo]|uniref:(apollo) hypothetical protein n=1 Tax=Parnassius apollo TaxID=110799 RepID=A0A8S3XUC7_PARAO|nr:unnamed protein product [Parnassius apollo]